MAARSLAQGAGSILGLENTTLQPAEIAFETQTDASSAFTAGKRLNRNVAVFFTTDLSDVQRQTTMLQFWNLQGLPGLAIQGYNRTGEAERGANLIQRYQWGGGIADDRPTIRKIRFEGEWPVSRRRLRSATGLRAAEPYEPFLVFAAGLRLETTLAELGYSRARVRGETENEGRLPTVVFTVDAGPRQEFVFSGDRLPAPVRRAVIGTFRPSPTDRSFPEMERTVLRHLFSEGFPDGQVTVSRHADEIVVDVHRGERITLAGPEVEGLSAEEAEGLVLQASDPITLAELARNPERARRVVERWLTVDGFPDASLEDIWVTDDNGLRTVHFNVDAGRRLRVDRIEVVGSDPLGLIAEGVPGLTVGMPLDRSTIGQSVARVRSAYRSAGYAKVKISTAIEEDVLSVTIDPGTQREVGEITVSGLRHIRESVIVNGLTIEPGEVLLPAELDRSAVRTAFFSPVEKADITTRDVGYNRTDVEVDVVEKDRWTVEAGAGWNSERGGNFQFGVGDDGLLGRGAGLSLRGQIDGRQRQLGVWAAVPPKPGSRWSTVANILWFDGDNREDPDRLEEERIGGAVETSYRLHPSASIRGYLRAVRSEIDVHDPRDDPFDFFPITTRETVIGSLVIWDRLDNPFDPTSGYHAAVDLSHSAPSLGSDFNDLRLVLSGGLVTEHRDRWVWRQRLRLGAAKPLSGFDMSSDRLFFAGGQATVRGFELDSIGPVGPSGRVIGGESLFVLNEELHVPVWGQLGVAGFVDVGQVWETWSDANFDFSVGAGFGLRYRTPIGPLWADVAWPVANLNVSEPGAKFYFGLGTSF
jgi:translocation and assembly module TamA